MKKLLFSLVLMFFVFIGTVRVYGFYQDTKVTQLTEVKTHQLLTQNLMTDNDKNLVPKGSILGVNDTEEFVFEYQVFVQKDLEIEYTVNDIRINQEEVNEDISNLFNFDFEYELIKEDSIQTQLLTASQEGYFVKITLTVSMSEPTYQQYQLIANQAMNFDVLFSVN
ncbi:hypothetical protein KHQ88_00965 [Mycoplasmatota bacterium]|nr:hypothetical protein KHQ88_00965 [Mycoplasmatota bacterium]